MPDKIALVADEDTVLGFGALGMECHAADTADKARIAFSHLVKDKYAVVFITDEVAEYLEEERPALMKTMLIMTIPSCRSRKSMGLQEITAIVEKAVGIANIMDKA